MKHHLIWMESGFTRIMTECGRSFAYNDGMVHTLFPFLDQKHKCLTCQRKYEKDVRKS